MISFRHLLGAIPTAARRHLLSQSWFPLLRTFQLGTEWAYDVSRFAGTRQLPVLFDVGAHVGETSLYLRRFFPSSRIHAFEFVPSTVRQLRQNVRSFPNISVHELALGRTAETLEVPLQTFSKVNSLRFGTALARTTATENVRVAVTTIDAFCATHGIDRIDVLKTDAEGTDLHVLMGAAGLISRRQIRFVFCEVNFTANDEQQRFEPLHQFLTEHGYHLAGFYEPYVEKGRLHFCNVLYGQSARPTGRPPV